MMTKTKVIGENGKLYPRFLEVTSLPLPMYSTENFIQQPVVDSSGSVVWYVLSILSTIFCCLPCSVIGLVHVIIGQHEHEKGNAVGYRRRMRQGKCWTSWSIAIGLLLIVALVTGFAYRFAYHSNVYYGAHFRSVEGNVERFQSDDLLLMKQESAAPPIQSKHVEGKEILTEKRDDLLDDDSLVKNLEDLSESPKTLRQKRSQSEKQVKNRRGWKKQKTKGVDDDEKRMRKKKGKGRGRNSRPPCKTTTGKDLETTTMG